MIAYYGFVSLFPLLLLLSTILGFLLSGDPRLQQQILHSALSQFPVIGNQLGNPKSVGGGATGLIIGILGSLYGGLGVAQAIQYAMNTAWQVPKNSRPNPFKASAAAFFCWAPQAWPLWVPRCCPRSAPATSDPSGRCSRSWC